MKPNPTLGPILGLQGFSLLEPLEFGYLAAALPRRHQIRVLDLRLARFPDQAFAAALRRFAPELIAFTGYTHEASANKRLARLARQLCPAAAILVGGHHATVAPDDYDLDTFDAVVRGEGTGPFRAIVAAVERGEGMPDYPMVLTRNSQDASSGWPVYPDPSTIPSPRRDLWPADAYRSVWLCEEQPKWSPLFPRVSLVRSSYGCRMKCSFCIVPHISRGEHRPRQAEVVAEDIAAAPAEHIYFVDDENFIDPEHGWALAEALARRGVKKRYFAWTRATTVNRSGELLRRWREIGLDAVFIGFEFSSDAELRSVHKGGSVAHNERAVDTLRAMGIAVHAAFLILPEWTRDDFARLRSYVRSLPPTQCSFTVCTPSPGTPDYREMENKIWVENPYDLYDCMHPLTPTAVPLREFSHLYARQASEGLARVPMRVNRHLAPLRDMSRAWFATRRYERAFRRLYRDYPRALWT